jgi:hypothetical protein
LIITKRNSLGRFAIYCSFRELRRFSPRSSFEFLELTNPMFQKTFAETPSERACNYRALALTAEENAAGCSLPSQRDAYLRTADRWYLLASLLEKGAGYMPRKIVPRPGSRTSKADTHAT